MKKCSVCQEMADDLDRDKKHNHEVVVNDRLYIYNLYYDLLNSKDEKAGCVRCARCHNDSFRISYGSYECIANCSCGHGFTIYDG